MKKILSILLVLSMLLSAVMMASCDLGDDSGDDEEQTDENGNVIDDDNGGDNSGSSDGSDFGYEQSESEKKLAELAAKGGYEISYTFDNGDGSVEEYTCGAKDNASWYIWGGEGHAVVKTADNMCALYDYNAEEKTWSFQSNMAGDTIDTIIAVYAVGFNVYMYWANAYGSDLESTGTTVMCGRQCLTYKYDYSFLGNGAFYTVNVDKETGITMEYKLTVKDGGDTATAHYQVTSFKTGVSTPDLPAPGEDYTDYSGALGWPSNSFTAMLPAVTFGKVSMSGIQGSTFSAVIAEATADHFNAYVAALQAKGFNGENTGVEGYMMFQGADANDNAITVTYSGESLIISFEKYQ